MLSEQGNQTLEIFMLKMIGLFLGFVLYSSHAQAFVLKNAQNFQNCLDINHNDVNDWRYLSNAELVTCNGLDHQQINVLPRGEVNGKLSFVLRMLNRCLEVDQTATRPWTAFVNVQLQPCRGAPHQRWFLESVGPDWQKVRSVVDGRCLEVDMNPASGWRFQTNIQVRACTGERQQLWRFDDYYPGT
jgi:hypothetical protein